MKTYSVHLAVDIPHHGTTEIQAPDDAAALAAARNPAINWRVGTVRLQAGISPQAEAGVNFV